MEFLIYVNFKFVCRAFKLTLQVDYLTNCSSVSNHFYIKFQMRMFKYIKKNGWKITLCYTKLS